MSRNTRWRLCTTYEPAGIIIGSYATGGYPNGAVDGDADRGGSGRFTDEPELPADAVPTPVVAIASALWPYMSNACSCMALAFASAAARACCWATLCRSTASAASFFR